MSFKVLFITVSSLEAHVCIFNVCVLQEVDEGHLEAVALAVDLEDLMRTMAFLRLAFDEVMKVMKIHLVTLN